MTWTNQKPTEPGFYWLKTHNPVAYHGFELMNLTKGYTTRLFVMFHHGSGIAISEFDCDENDMWYGPVELPAC